MLHDLLVLIGILVAISSLEPVSQRVDDLSDVVVIESEVEVLDITSLVEEWLINEMPSFLVYSIRLTLDKVSIGGALGEWMFLLILSIVWIGVLESFEDGENFVKSVWVLLLKDLLGNSRSEQVTVVPPGTRNGEQHAYDKQ